MDITCTKCNGTGLVHNNPCAVCGGDGKLNLEDTISMDAGMHKRLIGIIAEEIISKIVSLETKVDDTMDRCNDIMDKCNDIFEKVSE